MIGHIAFRLAGQEHTATLTDALVWRCDDAKIESMLNENWPAYRVPGEDEEALGRHMLYRAAYRLGGTVCVDRRAEPVGA